MALVSPAQKDGFSYAVDTLYCEASNSSRHRRATIPELKSHFNGKDTENRTAHWYEAQLLHYGLPPSKVKGTAHKRLFDAVSGKGGLTVPAHIQKIEADLKKEWNKKEREAKKLTKASSSAAAAPAKGTKRKAEQVSNTNVSVNVSVQVSSTGAVKVGTAQPAAKKTKTSAQPSSLNASSKKTAAVASKEKKTTSTKSQKVKRDSKPTTTPKPAKPAAKARAPAKPAAERPAASASFSGRGTAHADYGASSGDYEDDAPPPYSEYDEEDAPVSHYYSSPPRRSIGLLNGRYRVDCPIIEYNFPEYLDDLGIIATLDGNKLWLKFDLGAATGLMQVERPYEPDDEDGTMVFWRGFALDSLDNRRFVNIDTMYRAGPVNRLYFPGGGHIRGRINWDGRDVDFDAYRLSGQSMTSEVSPTRARAQWARLEQGIETPW